MFRIGRISALACISLWLGWPATAPADLLAPVRTSPWPDIVFHEIAWTGTTRSDAQQWIELVNTTEKPIHLDGWKLRTRSGHVDMELKGILRPKGSFLIVNDTMGDMPGIPAQMTLAGTLSPDGEELEIVNPKGRVIERVNAWHAGDPSTHATMQRIYPYGFAHRKRSWKTSSVRYDYGYGTPGFRDRTVFSRQALHQVLHGPDTINVFFNQNALTQYAHEGNEANHSVNIEERILHRIYQATNRIDITIYEINLPDMVQALMDRANEGIVVRAVVDSKEPTDEERILRYEHMRLNLERMARGYDGAPGATNAIRMLANSPIFAVTDRAKRRKWGLPPTPEDFPAVELLIGTNTVSGHLIVDAERRADGSYYRPGAQMHNKFVIIDDYRVFTTSMNFTLTDLYGDEEENRAKGWLRGNSNNGVEIHSPDVAAIYREEFNQMWGAKGDAFDAERARFSGRKRNGREPHEEQVGDHRLKILFSPGYNVIGRIRDLVEKYAEEKLYFAIFAWSDYELERIVKIKWEGDDSHLQGERTGFIVRGVFQFWDEWWSASANMTGRKVEEASINNPNIKWKNRPPVYRARDRRRLHHKYMIIDPDTGHQPVVVTGSANWSNNANSINDENTLFIFSDRIANQYLQEFYARYRRAGGRLD